MQPNEPVEKVSLNVPSQIQSWIKGVAAFAENIESFVRYMFVLSLVAFGMLAWYWISPTGSYWLNGLLAVILFLPVLICFVFWRVIVQLVDAPEEIAELVREDDNVIGGTVRQFSQVSLKEPRGLLSLFSTVRQLRQAEGLELLFDTVSGIALVANPFFAIAVILSVIASMGAAVLALILWLVF